MVYGFSCDLQVPCGHKMTQATCHKRLDSQYLETWHNAVRKCACSGVLEGKSDWGMGGPASWPHFNTSGIRRADIWQQNCEGLISFGTCLLYCIALRG